MATATEQVYYEVRFEDEHWNQNAYCTIPAAWVASVYNTPDGDVHKFSFGRTRSDAVEGVFREFPNAKPLSEAC
jgi:hypothetical protein